MRQLCVVIFALGLCACRSGSPVRPGRGLATTTPLERVVVSPDGRGFVLAPSRRPFHPWGLNYGNAGRLVEDFWDRDWEMLAGDFRELISSNTLEELDALERAGQLTIEQALWREWLRLFVRLGPELAPRLSP